ncbi:MAG: mechanosensitive ion channel [Rickettsiales bacterium]|jgi:small conductance mechanosensitive channel|nr:mechanosensitive ion channel [Rickettsiales bacterium]
MNITLESITNSAIRAGTSYGMKLLTAVAILIIGMWVVNRIAKSIKRIMERRNLEPSLRTFFSSFISIALKVLVVIITLTTVGVQMTSIVAILGAASLAVGMALSGTLQNFAGGIVILLFKPFKVGDTIQTASGRTGTVEKIMMFTTELHTADKQVVFLPNGQLSNGEIINLTDRPNRRVDIKISIAYGDDVEVARAAALKITADDKRVLSTPAPVVFVSNLGDSAVVITLRYWTKSGDYYDTQADILEQIYKTFPDAGLHFPFPQMDVHIAK